MARRLAIVLASGAFCSTMVLGAMDDAPPLAPPLDLPAVAVPAPPAETAAAPAIPEGPRPVLAVPGLAVPRATASRPTMPRLEPVTPPNNESPLPPLTGPVGAGDGRPPAAVDGHP